MAKKIPVIDYDTLVADICRISLGRLGHEVFCAMSGEQAVLMTAGKTFDLAIVNTRLEAMSGIEAFEMIRQTNPMLSRHPDHCPCSLDLVN